MGFRANDFASSVGLQYDKSAHTFWGDLAGYPVLIRDLSLRNTLLFQLTAKPAAEEPRQSVLEAWQMSRSGVSNLEYANNRLSCVLSIPKKEPYENLARTIAELVALARDHQLTACCAGCGAEYGYEPVLLDESPATLCAACQSRVRDNMDQLEADAAEIRPNITGNAVGIVLGTVVVFVLTWVVLKMGYLSYLTGYAGLLVGLMLMKKLGKKVTLPAGIIAIVLCIAAACAATLHSFSAEFAEFNQENLSNAEDYCKSYEEAQESLLGMDDDEISALEKETGENYTVMLNKMRSRYETCKLIRDNQTTGDCFRSFKTLLNNEAYKSAKPEFVKSIIWAFATIILGGAVTLPSILRESKGKHTLRVLR